MLPAFEPVRNIAPLDSLARQAGYPGFLEADAVIIVLDLPPPKASGERFTSSTIASSGASILVSYASPRETEALRHVLTPISGGGTDDRG